jgi:nucleoside-diphosphate-sugar epimerase
MPFSTSYRTCVLFGGTGFIGSHFAIFLLRHNLARTIILADILPVRSPFSPHLSDPRVTFVNVDVRDDPSCWDLPSYDVDLIINLAAIHREPGHLLHEYYETNLPGAENVCCYAERVNCNQIIFTSSIAPYGPSETLKTEASIPTPTSPYGASKLVAEKIHTAWQHAVDGRRLVIVRPGVVFGPYESGNVTRLVQASLRGYFVYMGNRRTRKAAGYVKELIISLLWMLNHTTTQDGLILYNFGMAQPPSVEDFVLSTFHVAGSTRFVPNLPFRFILLISYILEFLAKPFNISHPFSPVRIRKLVRSNNIHPQLLLDMHYPYKYSLFTAMQDWKHDSPEEWS